MSDKLKSRKLWAFVSAAILVLVANGWGIHRLETSLIYAHADTKMKRATADRIINAENSVFTNEKFKYQNDEETIKKLYCLALKYSDKKDKPC